MSRSQNSYRNDSPNVVFVILGMTSDVDVEVCLYLFPANNPTTSFTGSMRKTQMFGSIAFDSFTKICNFAQMKSDC